MTALAMIIGMIPMALALGEAGEQNAPLGRAVIGGLAFATFATLFLVPVFYTLLRRQPPSLHTLDKRFEAEAAGARRQEVPLMAETLDLQVASRVARTPDAVLHLLGVAVVAGGRRCRRLLPLQPQLRASTTAREARATAVERGPRVEVVHGSRRPERTDHHAARATCAPTRPPTLYAKVARLREDH